MSGKKLLAAAVLLASALGIGTGAAVLSHAAAQAAAAGRAAGGPPARRDRRAVRPAGRRPAGGAGRARAARAMRPGVAAGPGGMMGMGMGGGSAVAAAAPGVKWEYKTYTPTGGRIEWEKDISFLTKLGDDGWEVACVTYYIPGGGTSTEAYGLLLKRPKRAAGGGRGRAMGPGPGPVGPGMPGMGVPGPGGAGRGPGTPGGPAGLPQRGGGPGGGGPALGEGGGGAGLGEGTGGTGTAAGWRVALKHLQVGDLTPELRKQFKISYVTERTNTVNLAGAGKKELEELDSCSPGSTRRRARRRSSGSPGERSRVTGRRAGVSGRYVRGAGRSGYRGSSDACSYRPAYAGPLASEPARSRGTARQEVSGVRRTGPLTRDRSPRIISCRTPPAAGTYP